MDSDLFVSPLGAYARLLARIECTGSLILAAETVEQHVQWRWKARSCDSAAPEFLQFMADEFAWQRFESDDPITRQEVAAQACFRAAGWLACSDTSNDSGPLAARSILFESGQALLSEVVHAWLTGYEQKAS